jgi:outer membrane protein OmpA-like peptidoglycan-associated protein
MLRLWAAVGVLVLALPIGVQPVPAAQPIGTVVEIVAKVQDIHATVLDIHATVLDIRGTVLDIVGLTSNVKGVELGVPGSQVTVTAHQTRIELPADILFDFDKYNIRPSAADALNRVAGLLRERAKGEVRIEGHTDSKGKPAYNQRLSQRRADAVRRWLVERDGLTGIKFITVGFGATRPKVPNAKPDGSDDPGGRQINRRVEIVFDTG